MKTRTTSPQSSGHETSAEPATAPVVAGSKLPRLGNGALGQLLRARMLQAKLAISQPGDALEREADAMAERIMRMPDSSAHGMARAPGDFIQRAPDADAGEPTLGAVQESAIRDLASGGGGEPLPVGVRNFVEPRFGCSFESVRIHRDADKARSVNAKAFTLGSHVVVDPAHYAPHTPEGMKLLAHELTHVVQQGRAGGESAMLARAPRLDDPLIFERDDRLRWARDGKVIDERGFVAWALSQNKTLEQIVGIVENSHLFVGSDAAKARALAALRAEIGKGTIDTLRQRRQENQRAFEEVKEKEQAEEARRRKITETQARARVMNDRKSAVTSAMQALQGHDSSLNELYTDLQAARGTPVDVMMASRRHGTALKNRPRVAGIPRDLRRELRGWIEEQLQQRHGMGIAELDARVKRFETAFGDAARQLGKDVLQDARDLCESYRNEAGKLDTAGGEIDSGLAPIRAGVRSDLRRAQSMRREVALTAPDGEAMIATGIDFEAADKFWQSIELEKKALARVPAALKRFPFVSWPDFPREDLVQCTTGRQISVLLQTYFNRHIQALEQARSQLEDGDRIYKLDILVRAAKTNLGVARGSLFDHIVNRKVAEAKGWGVWEKVELALTFALIVASFAVPGAAVVTGPAFAAISAHQALQTLQEYTLDKAAFDVGLKSVEPSLAWVFFQLILAGLDAKSAANALKDGQLADAIRKFYRRRSRPQLGNLVEALEAARQKNPQLEQKYIDAIRKRAEKMAERAEANAKAAEEAHERALREERERFRQVERAEKRKLDKTRRHVERGEKGWEMNTSDDGVVSGGEPETPRTAEEEFDNRPTDVYINQDVTDVHDVVPEPDPVHPDDTKPPHDINVDDLEDPEK